MSLANKVEVESPHKYFLRNPLHRFDWLDEHKFVSGAATVSGIRRGRFMKCGVY